MHELNTRLTACGSDSWAFSVCHALDVYKHLKYITLLIITIRAYIVYSVHYYYDYCIRLRRRFAYTAPRESYAFILYCALIYYNMNFIIYYPYIVLVHFNCFDIIQCMASFSQHRLYQYHIILLLPLYHYCLEQKIIMYCESRNLFTNLWFLFVCSAFLQGPIGLDGPKGDVVSNLS